jgi:multicomponent Na+:H+ antiporter subunit C
MAQNILANLNYIVSMVLFSLGFYLLIVQRNVLKKIISLNIMETSTFLFLVSAGYLKEGFAPITATGADPASMVNPIPQALILTGIVVAVSTTALALALALKLYRHYGTLDIDEFKETGE